MKNVFPLIAIDPGQQETLALAGEMMSQICALLSAEAGGMVGISLVTARTQDGQDEPEYHIYRVGITDELLVTDRTLGAALARLAGGATNRGEEEEFPTAKTPSSQSSEEEVEG